MRRLTNLVAVVALSVLVAVAALDSLRSGRGAAPAAAEPVPPAGVARPPAPTLSERDAGRLRATGATGVLLVRDSSCRLLALRLPDLVAEPGARPTGGACTAFQPPGRLAIRNGEAVWFAVGDGHTVVLTRGELASTITRQVRAAVLPPELERPTYAVKRVAWLRGRRYAAVVGDRRLQQEIFALFDGTRLVRVVPDLGAPFAYLRASPRGSYVAVGRRDGALLVVTREGETVRLPELPGVRAITWSPDERHVALATDDGVVVLPAGGGDPARAIRLPLAARDLAWER